MQCCEARLQSPSRQAWRDRHCCSSPSQQAYVSVRSEWLSLRQRVAAHSKSRKQGCCTRRHTVRHGKSHPFIESKGHVNAATVLANRLVPQPEVDGSACDKDQPLASRVLCMAAVYCAAQRGLRHPFHGKLGHSGGARSDQEQPHEAACHWYR